MEHEKYIIVKDRVEVYKDFTINLLFYLKHYYLDKKTLSTDEDIENHFNFCFNKVCDEFLKEDINFKNNDDLREYFFSYYYKQLYTFNFDENNADDMFNQIEKFWRNIFKVKKINDNNIINVLIEVYLIFDESLEFEEKNVPETV